jgi:phosphoglycerol transferase MdoB-like AlkP superfamily enzyme
MQSGIDSLIGLVLHDIWNNPNLTGYNEPIIIFTSDHGEYAGSHNLHGKIGALYDEMMNVPLMIHHRNQQTNITSTFVCSSVDLLPLIYAASLGNDTSWRNSGDMIGYLANRESIFDATFQGSGDNTTQRRIAPFVNLPYVLCTMDEFTAASVSPFGPPT